MEWLSGYLPELSVHLSWYMILPVFLSYVVLPLTAFFFFCRYCMVSFRWLPGVSYALLSAVLCALEIRYRLQGSPGLAAEILLLSLCGCILLGRKWTESLAMSVLILAILSVSSGLASWIGYRLILPLILRHPGFVFPSDTVRECLRVLLACGLSAFNLHHFRQSIASISRQTLIYLTIPVFFISMVVRIIQTLFYGDEFQVDALTGEILSRWEVSHGELLFLQLVACVCLLVTLSASQKLLQILLAEQKVRMLEQQTAEQEMHMQEILLREQKTRAFRHDIKNHLTVLTELLKTGQTDRACDYLSHLDQAAAGLSSAVQTGNGAVDALLGSKLSVAKQKNIEVRCELSIPDHSRIEDMDWCALLANALDNAVRACQEVPEADRFLHMDSRRKGNFYLLTIENSCRREQKEVPRDGIGLANIRAVAEKYDGTVENTVKDGTYRLQLLFGDLTTEKKPFASTL